MKKALKVMAVVGAAVMIWMQGVTVAGDSIISKERVFHQKSEARTKYEQLLQGNYFAVELGEKFIELFGEGYTSKQVEENYTEIFDIPSAEIDEGFLELIVSFLKSREVYQGRYREDEYQIKKLKDIEMKNIPEAPVPDFIEAEPPVPEISIPLDIIDSSVVRNSIIELPIDELKKQETLLTEEKSDETSNSLEVESRDFLSESTNITNMQEVKVRGDSEITASSPLNKITLVSKTDTSITLDLYYVRNNDINNQMIMYDKSFSNSWSTVLKPAVSQRYTVNDLKAGGVYTFRVQTYDFGKQKWEVAEIKVQTTGLKPAVLEKINSTTTSITVKAGFPVEGAWGNMLRYWHTDKWIDITNQGMYAKSGNYTINEAFPGKRYIILMQHYNHMSNMWESEIRIREIIELPPEDMKVYSRSNIDFKLDKWFTEIFTEGRLERFLNKTNEAYDVMQELVGGKKPYTGTNKQRFETSRTMPHNISGLSGQPIQWSLYNIVYDVAPATVDSMNYWDADIAEVPIHEIAHNYQQYTWNFEEEALANFQVYYYVKQKNEKITAPNLQRSFIGSEYKDYVKSYVRRIENYNYDTAVENKEYTSYRLTYVLADIADKIGWEAFKKTFLYFDGLPYSKVPNTRIEKFNLFMTKLKNFSNYDVLADLTNEDKKCFEGKLGGTIQYISNPPEAVDENLFTEEEIFALARYFMPEGRGYRVGNEKYPLRDNNGRIVAYSVPYLIGETTRAFINVGAFRDGLQFYNIEEGTRNYTLIKQCSLEGRNIYYLPPFNYSLVPWNVDIEFRQKSNKSDAIRVLGEYEFIEESNIEEYMLQSENLMFGEFIPIKGEGDLISYGGNQGWWIQEPYVSIYTDGRKKNNTGCGTVAAANFFAYLATRTNKEKYGALLTKETAEDGYSFSKDNYVAFMDEMWNYLWKIPIFGGTMHVPQSEDMKNYARKKKVKLETVEAHIGDDTEVFRHVIRSGLEKNIPVLMFQNFLGENNWELYNDSHNMHVMTITKYFVSSSKKPYLVVSTWGERQTVNFSIYEKWGMILGFSVFYLDAYE